jgi:hypothetical protein
MMHPDIQRLMVKEHIATLHRDAQRPVRRTPVVREDTRDIELRMCRHSDNEALADLAALSERELPAGSFVLALADGKLIAAHSVDGGGVLADPFVRTVHVRRLLAVRAAQISGPRRHTTLRRLVRRSATA